MSGTHAPWNRTRTFIVIRPRKTRSRCSVRFSAVVRMFIHAASRAARRGNPATLLLAQMNGSRVYAKSRESNARSVSIAGFCQLRMRSFAVISPGRMQRLGFHHGRLPDATGRDVFLRCCGLRQSNMAGGCNGIYRDLSCNESPGCPGEISLREWQPCLAVL